MSDNVKVGVFESVLLLMFIIILGNATSVVDFEWWLFFGFILIAIIYGFDHFDVFRYYIKSDSRFNSNYIIKFLEMVLSFLIVFGLLCLFGYTFFLNSITIIFIFIIIGYPFFLAILDSIKSMSEITIIDGFQSAFASIFIIFLGIFLFSGWVVIVSYIIGTITLISAIMLVHFFLFR